MSALLDYRLSDLLLFSPEIYERLLLRYNETIFPLHLPMLGLGAILLLLILRDKGANQRLAGAILAIGWLWCGLIFHITYYDSINWMADYFAAVFLLQALLLMLWGYTAPHGTLVLPAPNASRWLTYAGGALVGLAVFVHPFLVLVEGRSLAASASFGSHPAPTIIATLGVMLALPTRWYSITFFSVLMLAVSGLTAEALGSPVALLYGLIGVSSFVVLVGFMWGSLRHRFGQS
jgi:hypothetical protein